MIVMEELSTVSYQNPLLGTASRFNCRQSADIWTLLYRKDNSYVMYVDGTPVQWGPNYNWTLNNTTNGTPEAMYFRFDGGLGATNVSSVDFPTASSTLNTNSIYYEYNYSRVYLR